MKTSSLVSTLRMHTARGDLAWTDWYPDMDRPVEPEAQYLSCTLPDGAKIALRHGILPYEYPLRRYTLFAIDPHGDLASEIPAKRGEVRLLWKKAIAKIHERQHTVSASETIARNAANNIAGEHVCASIRALD
ncbi:MAG: hypothetical protein ACP5OR_04360 [Candidatus Dormibacteria bacterium]